MFEQIEKSITFGMQEVPRGMWLQNLMVHEFQARLWKNSIVDTTGIISFPEITRPSNLGVCLVTLDSKLDAFSRTHKYHIIASPRARRHDKANMQLEN